MKVSLCVFLGFSKTWSRLCVFLGFLEVWSRLEGLYYWVLSLYALSGFREKNKLEFLFFFLNDADVENCGVSRGFGFIYIYR